MFYWECSYMYIQNMQITKSRYIVIEQLNWRTINHVYIQKYYNSHLHIYL